MIKRYNNISLATGIPGILLQIGGRIAQMKLLDSKASMDPAQYDLMVVVSSLAMLAGTALLLVGLAYYAKAKKRNTLWCLMAFLSLIGLIVLACLKDRDDSSEEESPILLSENQQE